MVLREHHVLDVGNLKAANARESDAPQHPALKIHNIDRLLVHVAIFFAGGRINSGLEVVYAERVYGPHRVA